MVMKRRLVLFVAAVLVIILCGSVYAAGRVAHRLSIDEETARNFAFVDAGILPEEAVVSYTEFDFENGRFVYEIEFSAQGIRYEYVIDAANGSVISREQEGTRIAGTVSEPADAASERADAASSETGQKGAALTPDPVKDSSGPRNRKYAEYIGVQLAKEIALKDAGLKAEDVTFSKAKLESDDREPCYDLEFYIAGEREYEYEIAAADGRILEKSSEKLTPVQTAVSQPAADLNVQEPETQKGAAQTQPPAQNQNQNKGTGQTQPLAQNQNKGAGQTQSPAQNQQSAAGSDHQNTGAAYDYDDDYDDYDDYDDDYDDYDDYDDDYDYDDDDD